jgi:4-hydroxy-4-methyl-2-oxoglutarate aldolase
MLDLADCRARLATALLSDVLDGMGRRAQTLPPRIRPLDEAAVLAGWARTALFMDVHEVAPDENPYAQAIALIDDLRPDDIPVFACGTSGRIAAWGELLSTAARARGAAGAVMDGLVRDVRAIRSMGFPVFHGGIGPLDSKGRGKVMQCDVTIACAGVEVRPGDFIFGDADGVIVVPRAIAAEAVGRALAKRAGEEETLAALQAGEKLATVFARTGIL